MKVLKMKRKNLLMTNKIIYSIGIIVLMLGKFHQAGGAVLRSGFPLMMEITDARLLALGGAALTEAGNVGAFAQNPASLYSSDRLFAVSYAKYPVDIWSGRLLGSGRLREFGVGIYLQTYGYGQFDEMESNQGATGRSFDASENLLGIGIAGDLFGRGSWGVAGKIDWMNLDGKSLSAGALDAGLTLDPQWEKFKFGLSIRNFGVNFDGNSGDKSPTPVELVLSASKRLEHLPLTLFTATNFRRKGEGDWNVDFLPNEPGLAFSVGGEFEILPAGAEKPFNLRFGYRSIGQGFRVGNSSDTFAGFSFGLGLFVQHLSIDYAFAPLGALGRIHRLGISRTL